MLLRLLLIIVLLLNLASCAHVYGEHGVIKNRETDYLKAQSIPPMEVPPGYDASSITPNYPVSDKPYSLRAARISLKPPGLNASAN